MLRACAFITRKYKVFVKSNLVYLIPLMLVSLYTRLKYAHGIYTSPNGFPKTHDTYWYMDHANELLQNFKIVPDFNGVFYIGYYGLLAFVLWIFKSEVFMIWLQVIINALSVVLVFRIAEMVFNRRVAVIAGILYIASYELKFWSVYLLTDSLFVTNVLLTVFFWLAFIEIGKKKYLYSTAGSMLYMVILRPAGIITLGFFIFYLILSLDYKKLAGILRKRLFLSIIGITGGVAVLGFVAYKVVLGSVGMSFFWNLRWLLYGNYSAGQIFDIPTPYDHKFTAVKSADVMDNYVLSYFIHNGSHILILYIKRFFSFWGDLWIWHFRFQSRQEALRYFTNLAPILLMVVGMGWAAFGKRMEKALLLFIPIISAVLFCMIFFLDNAWRYRLPSIPFSRIFMACGIEAGIQLLLFLANRVGLVRWSTFILRRCSLRLRNLKNRI